MCPCVCWLVAVGGHVMCCSYHGCLLTIDDGLLQCVHISLCYGQTVPVALCAYYCHAICRSLLVATYHVAKSLLHQPGTCYGHILWGPVYVCLSTNYSGLLMHDPISWCVAGEWFWPGYVSRVLMSLPTSFSRWSRGVGPCIMGWLTSNASGHILCGWVSMFITKGEISELNCCEDMNSSTLISDQKSLLDLGFGCCKKKLPIVKGL